MTDSPDQYVTLTAPLVDPRILSSEVTVDGVRYLLINEQRTPGDRDGHLCELLRSPIVRLP